jgi:hypothetical protein
MYQRLMQSASAVAPRHEQRQPHPAAAPTPPDYKALVDVLARLFQIPDGLGETILLPEEAAAIRKCGFKARAGCTWRCPVLPDELVRLNPLLRHLSDAIHPLNRPAGWKPKRAAEAPYNSPGYAITKYENRLYKTLFKAPGQCLRKRELQHRNWRMHARFFNCVLGGLIQRGSFTVFNGWIYPYNHETFGLMFNTYGSARKRQ